MKCLHSSEYTNKHSFSNHRRWCEKRIDPNCMKGINKGVKNGQWKGDSVKYIALHLWVKSNWEKIKKCSKCDSQENIDLANVTGVYGREFNNWDYLCRKHHMQGDGRMNNLIWSHSV